MSNPRFKLAPVKSAHYIVNVEWLVYYLLENGNFDSFRNFNLFINDNAIQKPLTISVDTNEYFD